MLHMMFDKKYWFKPKRFGWGAVPHSWQGWAFLGLYIAFCGGMAYNLQRRGEEPGLAWFAGIFTVTAIFIFVCWKKTEGGWQWNWGRRS